MTRDARVANLPLVVGSILIVSGVVCNPWLVGALLSPDGQIGRSSYKAVMWGIQIALVLSGVTMVRFRRRPSVWKAASVARLLLLIAWTLLVLEISVRAINSVYALERPPHLKNTNSYEWLEGGDWFNGLTRLVQVHSEFERQHLRPSLPSEPLGLPRARLSTTRTETRRILPCDGNWRFHYDGRGSC